MSRVGLANFKIPSGSPNCHDQSWREGLNREQWDHLYHAMRVDDPKCKYSYKNAQTEAKDKLSKTWHIMSHVYSSAAGQGSYHYNLQKPTGNVQVYLPSASFSFIPRNAKKHRQELLSNTALFENGNPSDGLGDHLLSRNHLDNLWATTGNYDAGASWKRGGQDKEWATRPINSNRNGRRTKDSIQPMNPTSVGYDKSVYNEAFYNEGLYNSDVANKHCQRTIGARHTDYQSSSPEKRVQKWIEAKNGRSHSSINARNEKRPRSSGGEGSATLNSSGGRSRNDGKFLGNTNLQMSKTWGGSAGFFRDGHGEKNPHRVGLYEHTVGRFDQIRDDRPSQMIFENRGDQDRSKNDHEFLDVHGDPTVTNPRMRYSHTLSGPFFQPRTNNEGLASNNRAAVGPLKRGHRQHPPRYEMHTDDHPGPRARRVNQPSVPSFNRIMAQ